MTREEAEAKANERWPIDGDYFNRGGVVSSFIEGALWASSQSPTWVKASERLPGKKVICKWYVEKRIQISIEGDEFLQRMLKLYNSDIVWLDESESPQPDELTAIKAELERVTGLLEERVRIEWNIRHSSLLINGITPPETQNDDWQDYCKENKILSPTP